MAKVCALLRLGAKKAEWYNVYRVNMRKGKWWKDMSEIKSCQFNIDNACIEIIYSNDSMVSIYTPMVEESLCTTIQSRSKLDRLIENEPLEYAQMILDGTVQEYLDQIDDIERQQMKSYIEKLAKHYPPSIAEDIAREIMMYS